MWLTNTANSNPREPDAVFWPAKALRPICGTQTNKQTKYSHTYKEKEKKKIEQTNVKEKGSIINVKNFKDQQKM